MFTFYVMMMMIMMMNCLCGMVDRRKAFSVISSQEIVNLRHAMAEFEPAHNLSSGLAE